MPSLKGSAWGVNFDFIRERFGPDALEKIFGTMGPEDQALLRKPGITVASVWGPDFTVYMRFILTADKVFGQGDLALIKDAAIYQFHRDTRLYSLFFHVMSPGFILKKTPLLWGTYFNPSGKFEVKQLAEKHFEVCLTEFDPMPLYHDAHHSHYMAEIFKNCGVKKFSITHSQCLARGNPCCLWDTRWE